MDEEVETLLVGVRADTAGFARDAAAMRDGLTATLGAGADRGAAAIERSLARAVKSGQLGFDDLRRTALSALSEIAAQALKGGLSSLVGGTGGGGDGTGGGGGGATLVSLGTRLLGAALGLPGRATGGPVSPGAAYVVGERGPELFVPTSAGSIAAAVPSPPPREVRVAISIAAAAGQEPQALARSGRQVARAVAAALAQADR